MTPTDKRRNSYYLRTYGITLAQYNEMLKDQGHKCAICGKPHTEDKRLHVDHDHKTMDVRGLLCGHCNLRVIGRHRDAQLFLAAHQYLAAPRRGWIVPANRKRKRRKRK